MQSYKELTVWQRGMELVRAVYLLTKSLPEVEAYGLFSQMRRAAVSIVSNIAEGYRRRSRRDYVRFLCIADGSTAELETQLLLVETIYPIVDVQIALALNSEVQKTLGSLIRKLS